MRRRQVQLEGLCPKRALGICNEQNNEKDTDIDGDTALLAACDTGPAVHTSFM